MAASAAFPFCKPLAPLSLLLFFVYRAWCVSADQQLAQTFDIYRFPNFNSTTANGLALCGSATYDHDSLQVGARTVTLGRSHWRLPVLASFSTVFDMSISHQTEANTSVAGDGLSFVVFQSSEIRPGNYSICSNWSRLMAVEIDAQNNQMAFRSLLRNTSVWLNNSGVELSPTGERMLNHTVWIDFNPLFSEQGIQVYTANQGNPKPWKPVLSVDTQTAYHILGSSKGGMYNNLSNALNDFIYFGFTGFNENSRVKPKTVWSWMLSVGLLKEQDQPTSGSTLRALLALLFLATVVILLLIPLVLLVRCLRNKKRETDFLGKALRSLPGMPKEFKYAELRKATNKFSTENKLGQGGFGEVYKGKLPKEQTWSLSRRSCVKPTREV